MRPGGRPDPGTSAVFRATGSVEPPTPGPPAKRIVVCDVRREHILGAGLAALLALAGCGGKAGLPASRIVTQTAAKTAAVKSFHLLVDIEHVPAPATGISVTFLDGDVLVPARLHARVGGSFQGVPLSSELIVIGSRHYLKNPLTGRWQVVSVSMSPVSFFDPVKGVLAVVRGARDVADDGSEKIGGAACYRLTARVRPSAVAPLLGKVEGAKLLPITLWVGKRDLLLRRIRLSGPIAAGEGANAERTVELSAFGEQVRITAPPVSS